MTYSSLYCVLTDDALVEETLAQALATAGAHNAHLDVLCLGVDHSPSGYDLGGASAIMMEQTITRAREDAETIEAHARAILEASGTLWSASSGLAQMAGLSRHVAAKARFSDLVVLPRPYGDKRGDELEVITEAALFDASTPVLITREASSPLTQPERVIVAWNNGTEALNAVRASLPMMRQAQTVHVAVIDPPTHGPTRSDPGGMLAQYLARHGIKVEVNVLAKTMPHIADVLNRHAEDINADLIVMGAYGHSRIREAMFGGATRDMLSECNRPVLMAH